MDLLPVAAGTRDRFAEGKREIQSSASCWFMCPFSTRKSMLFLICSTMCWTYAMVDENKA